MAAAAIVAISAGLAFGQDIAAGEKSFAKCRICHDVGPNAKHKVGPILNGLENRKAGTIEGYTYSPANIASGIVWSHEAFDTYITNPARTIPNTKMAFIGISNPQERANLWAYLAQFNADGSKK
jgi:cytochrome c